MIKLQPIICMLSATDYHIVSQYPNVQEAAEDTLTSADDIKLSLAEGCAINGYVWNRQYVPKSSAKSVSAKIRRLSTTKKSVVQYDLNDNIVNVFDSVSQAHKLTGITNIDKAARGAIQLAGGYKWQYIDNNK